MGQHQQFYQEQRGGGGTRQAFLPMELLLNKPVRQLTMHKGNLRGTREWEPSNPVLAAMYPRQAASRPSQTRNHRKRRHRSFPDVDMDICAVDPTRRVTDSQSFYDRVLPREKYPYQRAWVDAVTEDLSQTDIVSFLNTKCTTLLCYVNEKGADLSDALQPLDPSQTPRQVARSAEALKHCLALLNEPLRKTHIAFEQLSACYQLLQSAQANKELRAPCGLACQNVRQALPSTAELKALFKTLRKATARHGSVMAGEVARLNRAGGHMYHRPNSSARMTSKTYYQPLSAEDRKILSLYNMHSQAWQILAMVAARGSH